MNVEFNLSIELEDGKRLTFNCDEARELWAKLNGIFGNNTITYPVIPYEPITPPYDPWRIHWTIPTNPTVMS